MARTPLTIEQILTMLGGAPRRIADATAGLSPAHLRTRPAPDEWSATDVLAHIRACADVRGGAVHDILAEDHPTFRAIDPRAWMRKTDYPDLDFDTSFKAFTRQRAELMVVLESLPPEGWSRAATVTGAGKALERTVQFYAEWVAIHERPHIKQIAAIAAALK